MLDILGLSPVEQAVYEALLAGATTTPSAGDEVALDRLVALGLATSHPDPPRYLPVPPAEALPALLLARERELLAARGCLAELDELYHQAAPPAAESTAVEVVHGARAVMLRFFDVQRDAPSQVRGIESPPYIAADDPDDTVVTLLDRGLRYRILYTRQALDLPGRPYGMVLDVSDGRQARVGDVKIKLALTDQPIGFLPLHTDPGRPPAALVVRDATLLAALSALFELCWDRAVPINARAGTSDVDQALLPLLVAGLTDQEIAAKLDWSHRTVRRRVRDLMTRLGAQTRFQAGHQAVMQGWLEGNDGR